MQAALQVAGLLIACVGGGLFLFGRITHHVFKEEDRLDKTNEQKAKYQ